jgi:AraC family transcriptional regulator
MGELTLLDTNGILRQPWVCPDRTSTGLGWSTMYVSSQREQPYRAAFDGAVSHLVILHRSGPVTVRRGHLGLHESRKVPAGGFFVHPAGKDLTVELGGVLDTVHVYLSDDALQNANDGGSVELVEELGVVDPVMEQLVLALDSTLGRWEPAGRTYVDQIGAVLAAHLARRHATRHSPASAPPRPRGRRTGLSDRQVAGVRDLVQARLAEPVPLADMAAVAGLSVSQFARQFKARVGLSPHQYLLRLRVDTARRMLTDNRLPIADVASRCGFSHQEHLTRVLSARLGITPAAIRRGDRSG